MSLRGVKKVSDWGLKASVVPLFVGSEPKGVYEHQQGSSVAPNMGTHFFSARRVVQNAHKPELKIPEAFSFHHYLLTDQTTFCVVAFLHFDTKASFRPAFVAFGFRDSAGAEPIMIPVSALAVDLGAVPTADMRKFLECAVQNHLYDEITQCKTLSIKFVDIVAQSTGRREAAPPLTLLSENSYSECTKKAEQDAKIVIERAAAKRGREELAEKERVAKRAREELTEKDRVAKSRAESEARRLEAQETRRRQHHVKLAAAPDSTDVTSTALVPYGFAQAQLPQGHQQQPQLQVQLLQQQLATKEHELHLLQLRLSQGPPPSPRPRHLVLFRQHHLR